jgi:hypothetical protein
MKCKGKMANSPVSAPKKLYTDQLCDRIGKGFEAWVGTYSVSRG